MFITTLAVYRPKCGLSKGEGFGHYPKEKELDEQFKQIRRREVDKEIRTKGYKLRMNKFYDQKS